MFYRTVTIVIVIYVKNQVSQSSFPKLGSKSWNLPCVKISTYLVLECIINQWCSIKELPSPLILLSGSCFYRVRRMMASDHFQERVSQAPYWQSWPQRTTRLSAILPTSGHPVFLSWELVWQALRLLNHFPGQKSRFKSACSILKPNNSMCSSTYQIPYA